MKKLCLLIAVAALAQDHGPPPGMRCAQRTLVTYNFVDSDKRAQLHPQHVAYILSLLKSGKLLLAGPMESGQTATGVFATTNWADIENMMKDEPFTREGLLKVASHEVWNACEFDPSAAGK
jgi:uncharacterized protein YciI